MDEGDGLYDPELPSGDNDMQPHVKKTDLDNHSAGEESFVVNKQSSQSNSILDESTRSLSCSPELQQSKMSGLL